MGVAIDVASLKISEARNWLPTTIWKNHNSLADYQLSRICTFFGWHKVPWEEPSEKAGIGTSAGCGRYSIALSLGWVLATQNLSTLIEIADAAELDQSQRSRSEREYPKPQDGFKKFPHFLDRDICNNYYLPVAFTTPCYFDWKEFHASARFSIASSHHLLSEIQEITPIMAAIVELQGEKTPLQNTDYTWGEAYALCLTLQRAAMESIELNLPVQITY